MRFGSVCSGIEAASAAWNGLGWDAAWFAEIEPFPSAVLAHHYPSVPNLGDMTALPDLIRSGEVEAPDLFCGGTPCQAFSVAGLRQSLSDARGNLSLTFCEIANAIDDVRRSRDTPPAIIFWENVPGVLSTTDNAFGCFLGALAGTDTALVSRSGWTNAGMVAGPRRRVVWRILDAQGFIPQRRRRVFVLAVGHEHRLDPRAVLFDTEAEVVGSLGNRLYTGPLFPVSNGLQRNFEAGAEARQIAPTIPARSTAGGGLGSDFDIDGGVIANSWPASVAPTLNAHFGEKMGLENQHALAGGGYSLEVAKCLITKMRLDSETETLIPTTGGCFSVYPLNTQIVTRHEALGEGTGFGMGEDGDPSFTLTKGHSHAVAFGVGEQPETAHCLRSGASKADKHESTTYVAQPVTYDLFNVTAPVNRQNRVPGDPCHTLARANAEHAVVVGEAQPIAWSEELTASVELAGTIQRGGSGGRHDGVYSSMAVRRLTPVECERLQGFPDNYTAIPWRNKSAEECPDGPRYKALGNSWAVPVVAWIGKRIEDQLK